MTPLEQLSSALTGRYEIEREIGAGGMATVFLARDVKHRRPVALKVLKPELGAVLGVERFLAEIQVTANLQHPNLLPLFDSGEAAGMLFYVMPFVEGESLRARLDRERQLPVDEAVRLSAALAGALEYAHQQGVIHRDLKPENILLQAGQPVIADFGIALAVSNAGGARVTQTGLSLGTPQYMSPEQATGDRAIDARTDIYSLAAMTYEMLTGEPPHTGATAQSIIAKLMTEDVRPLTVLRRSVPPHVDAAVRHGLEKLAADRFASAAEYALALTGARPIALPTGTVSSLGVGAAGNAAGSGAGSRARWRAIAAGLAVIATGGVGTALWQASRPAAAPAPLMRFELGLPDSVTLYTGSGTKLDLSRDGTKLVFVGVRDGTAALYIRRLDDPFAQLVRGTEMEIGPLGTNPRFSPNGEWIAFATLRGIQRIAVTGGTPQSVADSGGVAPRWIDGRSIIYSRPIIQGAFTFSTEVAISTDEGTARRVSLPPDTSSGIFGYKWPFPLPGGTHALVTIDRSRTHLDATLLRLGVLSLKDGSVSDLGVAGTNPHYVASGHVVFGRAPGLVFSAPFSLKERRFTGPPVQLLEGVWLGAAGATGFAVSDRGTLAYHLGSATQKSELVLVDRAGGTRPIPKSSAAMYEAPRLSPDDSRLAVGNGDGSSLMNSGGLWLLDLSTGARQRLVEDGVGGRAEWSRDGTRVLFIREPSGKREIVARAWDRSAADSVVARDSGSSLYELAVGPRGGWSAFRVETGEPRRVFIAPSDSLQRRRRLNDASVSPEFQPSVSADGSLVAYVSAESGRNEVYLQPLPGPGPRLPVSVEGGVEPVWSKSGHTLFYRGPTHVIAAEIGGSPARVISREQLFADAFARSSSFADQWWDVFSDGRRFLMLQSVRRQAPSSISIVVNWQQAASQKRGGGERE